MKKILIIEDNPDLAAMFECIEDFHPDWAVTVLNSKKEALTQLNGTWDILFCDCEIPESDVFPRREHGYEVMAAFKKRGVYTVAMSGNPVYASDAVLYKHADNQCNKSIDSICGMVRWRLGDD